ncbi:hypothetical protein D3C80_1915840 [compost metagenome]
MEAAQVVGLQHFLRNRKLSHPAFITEDVHAGVGTPVSMQHLFGNIGRQIGSLQLLPPVVIDPRTVAGNQITLQAQLRHDRLCIKVVAPGGESHHHFPFNKLL